MPDLTKVGRIAFRSEGEYWNAYYALNNTMEGALHLGSVKLEAVRKDPTAKEGFMMLMRVVVGNILEDMTSAPVQWQDPQPAPESERSGHS